MGRGEGKDFVSLCRRAVGKAMYVRGAGEENASDVSNMYVHYYYYFIIVIIIIFKVHVK